MLSTLLKWADFIKFSHTVFALPFALAAMLIAARDNNGWPGWEKFLLILAAMASARTCAMSFNRIADREFDAQNPRTAGRHLPTGKLTLASAWTLCIVSGLGLVVASYFLNSLCFYLSPVALFIICFYSITKRFTDYTHIYLGIALALAPVGGWLAVKGMEVTCMEIICMSILAVIVVLWLIGFDIIYAIQDYEFDREHKLHSLVVAWGPQNALIASFLSHMFMWGLLVLFGMLCRFRIGYLLGLLVILACLVSEHWIARRRGLGWAQTAFFRLNAVISAVFLIIVAAEVVFKGGFRFK
jgi:4-hydroxybenzoate polyprenyltransferase